MTLHDESEISRCTKLIRTRMIAGQKRMHTGNKPNKNVVAFNKMVFILQQIVLADVAAGICSRRP